MNAAIDQGRLVAALARSFPSSGRDAVRVLETHISFVLLTGPYAYKIKKAVEFGFLDFRTLEARRFFCEEELRLNRRLAPELYIDVVPITGSVDAPVLGGDGPVLEYAVRMREFPQDALAGALSERGELTAADIDALAEKIAAFHETIDRAGAAGAVGTPAGILRLALQNLAEIDWLTTGESVRGEIAKLRAWTEREFRLRGDAFCRRLEQGFVRECHGDLHLGNIARVDGELVVFDGIEFNDEFRWIDTMSEVAFTVMDLEDRGHADLAARFLNAYLERTGDYAGLEVLSFYLVYRALVRTKVALLRAAQQGDGKSALHEGRATSMSQEAHGYLALAAKYAQPPHPTLIVTCGLSGSGKTSISQALLERVGAVRVRSDVERKRMRGTAPLARSSAEVGRGLYAPQETDATYCRLRELARSIVETGRTAIVDATFLKRSHRQAFHALADELRVPFQILSLEADEATLRQRIAQRSARGTDASDADLAVLAHQIATREALTPDERRCAIDAHAVLESRALAFRDVQWREAPWPWNLYPVCPRGADSGND
jgi:aminoglycoside phosphotransferase family enzyme/predicted kinase